MIWYQNKISFQDALTILIMLIPIGILLAPIMGLMKPYNDGLFMLSLLGLPIILGLGLSLWLFRKQKRKLAWFCIISGFIPISLIVLVFVAIDMGWTSE